MKSKKHKLLIRCSKKHFLTYSPDGIIGINANSKMSEGAWDFLSALEDATARQVALAYIDGELVGWFRFSVLRGVLYAQGTWVEPGHRRKAVAYQLWEAALNKNKPKSVRVAVVSPGGRKLVRLVSRVFNEIEFSVKGFSKRNEIFNRLANQLSAAW